MSAKNPKNIVVCCDGTGNQFSPNNSNVVKIYTCLHVGGEDKAKGTGEQVAYYHPGVGTLGAQNRPSKLGQLTSKIAGLAFGAGFQANISDPYQFLMENYADGDRVFLFGFSRGAYTVRALAGMLQLYGLLCKGNEGHLPYVYRNYSIASKKAFNTRHRKTMLPDSDAAVFKQTFSRDIRIHFAGVWDTVSTIGWVYDPVKLLFDAQNPIYCTGRHAISIDERRCYFQSNPWGEPLTVPEPDGAMRQQDIIQAWFPGVHSDVGGSYEQTGCAPAQEALCWILDEARKSGLLLNDRKCAAVFGVSSPGHEELADYYKQPKPFTRLHDSLTWQWWPAELLPHVYFDVNGEKRLQIEPWPHRRELPPGALLHPSVGKQRQAVGYTPKNIDFNSVKSFENAPPELLKKQGIATRSDLKDFSVYVPEGPGPAKTPTSKLAATAAVAAIGIGAAWLLSRH